jgi:hypothetical protein
MSEDLWKVHIQLIDAEEAFRVQKDDLKLRPAQHQKEHRAKAHISVRFLAYVLRECFVQFCKQPGSGNEPRAVIEEIKNLSLTDVILPAQDSVEIQLPVCQNLKSILLLSCRNPNSRRRGD